jgi:hypothetical protein
LERREFLTRTQAIEDVRGALELALDLAQREAKTRRIRRERELLALQEELADAKAEIEKGRLLREITVARLLAHRCQRCHVPFNQLREDGSVQVNAKKGRKVCYRSTAEDKPVGNPECVKAQDAERKEREAQRKQRDAKRREQETSRDRRTAPSPIPLSAVRHNGQQPILQGQKEDL